MDIITKEEILEYGQGIEDEELREFFYEWAKSIDHLEYDDDLLYELLGDGQPLEKAIQHSTWSV